MYGLQYFSYKICFCCLAESLSEADVQEYAAEHPYHVVESLTSNYSEVNNSLYTMSVGLHITFSICCWIFAMHLNTQAEFFLKFFAVAIISWIFMNKLILYVFIDQIVPTSTERI